MRKRIQSESDSSYLKSSVTDAAEYIHSFKVGRVGDEELFDVIQFTHSFQLEAQAKRSVAPCESGSLIRRILFVPPTTPCARYERLQVLVAAVGLCSHGCGASM